MKLDLVSYSTHHKMFKVMDDEEGKNWYSIGIYVWQMSGDKEGFAKKCEMRDTRGVAMYGQL